MCTVTARISDKVPGSLVVRPLAMPEYLQNSQTSCYQKQISHKHPGVRFRIFQQKQIIFRIRQIAFSERAGVAIIFHFQNSTRLPCFHVTHVSSSIHTTRVQLADQGAQ
jgi:hypothetical protein